MRKSQNRVGQYYGYLEQSKLYLFMMTVYAN